jgi:hypothetical protein
VSRAGGRYEIVETVDMAKAAALLAANPGGAAATPELWIDRYQRAWEAADAGEVVDLFTADSSYRSSLFREPYIGSDAIRQYWQR